MVGFSDSEISIDEVLKVLILMMKCCILLYADGVVIIAEKKNDLWLVLDIFFKYRVLK